MPKMSSIAQSSPDSSTAKTIHEFDLLTPTDQPISRRGCPKAPKRKKKKKKKKQTYKEMMASITRSSMTAAEKIQEKKDALNTPSCEPQKLVTI